MRIYLYVKKGGFSDFVIKEAIRALRTKESSNKKYDQLSDEEKMKIISDNLQKDAYESEDSYERTYTTPETVVIKGKRSTIDSFSGITANEIDIAYYYEDSEIPIEFDFPEGVSIADGQDQLLLKLKVVEKKQKEKDKDKENDSENESDNENG